MTMHALARVTCKQCRAAAEKKAARDEVQVAEYYARMRDQLA